MIPPNGPFSIRGVPESHCGIDEPRSAASDSARNRRRSLGNSGVFKRRSSQYSSRSLQRRRDQPVDWSPCFSPARAVDRGERGPAASSSRGSLVVWCGTVGSNGRGGGVIAVVSAPIACTLEERSPYREPFHTIDWGGMV